jgi:hypothetical protein
MTRKILATSVVTAMMLTACGGGGDPKQSQEAVKKVTLKGTAVDELILNGKVKVTKPDATLLVEGRTSADKGTYTLDVENYTGPVIINVTCDADSRLLIGTTQEACPTDLDLNSVANAEGKAVVVNVSPLSDAVYQIAKKSAITKESIDKATNQVSSAFGVNPILNDPTTGAYADIVEAFHEAADNTTGKDLFDIIDDLAEDMSDGTIDNSDALGDALKDANVETTVPATNEEPTVIPNNPASLDDKAQVKAFIQDLRTQGTTMESYANNEAEAMGTALEDVALDVQTVADYVLGITDLVVQAREDGNTTLGGKITLDGDGRHDRSSGVEEYFYDKLFVRVTQSSANPNEWTYRTTFSQTDIYTGTISIPEITEGMEHTFTSLKVAFNGTLPYADDIYSSQTPDLQTQNISLDISLTKSGDVVAATLSDFSIENSGNSISIDSLTGSLSYSKPIDTSANGPIFNYIKLDAMTLTAVTGDYKATGTLSVPEYAVNSSLAVRGGMKEVLTTTAYLDIYCSSPATLDNPEATLRLDGVDYTYIQNYGFDSSAGFYLHNISGDYSQTEIESATTTSICSDNSIPTINASTWNDTDELIGNSGHIPKKISFEGSLKNTKTNGEISGSIAVELVNAATLNLVDNDNLGDEMLLKVDVSGKLLMPNRPETLVNIGYETKADDATKHSVTGSYSHDATLLTVAGALDKAGDNGQLTFTNGTGVQAQFILKNDAFVSGDSANSTGSLVTKGGKVVATIESRNDDIIIIKYLDGSFESIF